MLENPPFRLVACDRNGDVEQAIALPEPIRQACSATADLYRRTGFHAPWIGYVALFGEAAVGGGAFVGPPENNRVEIAYYTLPAWQGRGMATRTARHLVAIARAENRAVALYAKTLPQPNPSTRILSALGFEHIGDTSDDDIGKAWAWLLR